MKTTLTPPQHPFPGAVPVQTPAGCHAVLFATPHGTPYPGIDNRVHEESGKAIRAALAEDARWLDHWDFDLDGPLLAGRSDFRLGDLGDLNTLPLDGAGNRSKIEDTTRAILEANAVPIMIGGDDSVPIPFIAAFADYKPLTILQIDAHIDWRHERRGETMGYSSTMRRASEMKHVERIIQVGIRALGSARAEEVKIARDWGAQIVSARRIHEEGVGTALALVPEGANVLITLDADALDSAIMPAVMAPTPGGLTYWQMIDLIAGVAKKARVVGMDMIEFVPGRDHSNQAAAYLAGRILLQLVGQLARRS